MIETGDELLHSPSAELHWQESYYFNWSDPAHHVFGVARVGHRPNRGLADGIVFTVRNGRAEFCYPAISRRQREPWNTESDEALRVGGLSVRVIEPLRRFRLRLEGRHSMDLEFEAVSAPFDYRQAGDDRTSLPGDHFEQSGVVTGWTDFKGERLTIDAGGQRDKSWGVRDFDSFAGWDWITAQFGADLAFNASRVEAVDGGTITAGFVFRDGENHALESLTIHYRWGTRADLPAETRLVMFDVTGRRYEVSAVACGHFPVPVGGLRGPRAWIDEVPSRFELSDDRGTHSGLGVVEHLSQPDAGQTLRRLPELIPVIRALVRP